MKLSELTFVNINGNVLNHKASKPKRAKVTPSNDPFHKGWRVEGHSPGAQEAAEADHPRKIAEAKDLNTRVVGKPVPVPGPWDADKWMRETKTRPVRAEPYGIKESADECKAMAEKAGWRGVTVREIKREPQP